jgi:hypothetical protein
MNYSSDIDKIRCMIMSPAAYVEKLPFSVNSYNEVVKLWNKYKTTDKIDMDNSQIRNLFDFHKSNKNHVLMYYSFGQDNCLLMCRVGENYLNILADARPTDLLGYSYIASYC